MENKITITTDFSRYPGGRYKSEGSFSGELFREKILIPKLKEFSNIEIDINGTEGYGYSFIEEAFGGLVRSGQYKAEQLHKSITIKADGAYKTYEDMIWHCIDDAS